MIDIKLSYGIEPTTRAFLREVNHNPPLYTLPVEDARKTLSDLQSGDVAKLPADIEDHDISGGPNGQVSIRIIRPKGTSQVLPVVMYFHGGGWVLGDKDTHDRLVREIAKELTQRLFLSITRDLLRLSTPPQSRRPTLQQRISRNMAKH